ncbi:MAG: hypothetical protein NC311_06230 [Muribaculaceae bacterium]|nr:hypothetical protein [Muribaculaceae bacterium]
MQQNKIFVAMHVVDTSTTMVGPHGQHHHASTGMMRKNLKIGLAFCRPFLFTKRNKILFKISKGQIHENTK